MTTATHVVLSAARDRVESALSTLLTSGTAGCYRHSLILIDNKSVLKRTDKEQCSEGGADSLWSLHEVLSFEPFESNHDEDDDDWRAKHNGDQQMLACLTAALEIPFKEPGIAPMSLGSPKLDSKPAGTYKRNITTKGWHSHFAVLCYTHISVFLLLSFFVALVILIHS